MTEPKKLPILSLKGGTGKTTTCLGIAQAMKNLGIKVGLLDVDIHASALPRALNLNKAPGYDPILGGKLRPINHDGFQVFSIGLLFNEDVPNMWDGEMKRDAVKQIATTSIAWDEGLEWVVVDTPPTSGDEVQSLLDNLENIYGAVIICQPNDLAVLALAKTLNVLRETEIPVAGIIANMAGYRCPNCGHVSNPFDRDPLSVQELAKEFKVKFLGMIPFAQESERVESYRRITRDILSSTPVYLKKQKGGVTRWAIEKILK